MGFLVFGAAMFGGGFLLTDKTTKNVTLAVGVLLVITGLTTL